MTDHDEAALIDRLVSQRLKMYELDQVNNMIRDGVKVYLAMFEFRDEHHALQIKSVSEWTPEATELIVRFSEKILPDKRIHRDDEVTVYYLRPFNSA